MDLLGFYQTLKRDAANPASPIALSLAHLKEKMTMMTMMTKKTIHPRHLLTATKKNQTANTTKYLNKTTQRHSKTAKHRKPPS